MTIPLPRVITVDGPAGSGKSSVSFAIAADLGYLFVDTGAFYRAITLAALRAGLENADEQPLENLARHSRLDILPATGERQYTVLLNGEDVTEVIRESRVEASVSRVAALQAVRSVLNEKYRELATRGGVIMAGRDIGTIVLPDADLKIYLDASPEARAARRYKQRAANNQPANYDEILATMRARDAYDSGRTVDPLRRANDAYYLHTDHLSVEQVIEHLEQVIRTWKKSPVDVPSENPGLSSQPGR